MSEMPKEIFVRPRSYGDGWSALQDTDTVKFAGDVKYLRADTIVEASKRVSEYKADMSKYPMLEQTERAKKREQERAETLDRAIKFVGFISIYLRGGVLVGGKMFEHEVEKILGRADSTLTELKKLRGEG
jgi:hypothetical protein